MDRLDGLQIIQAVFGAPGAKAAGGPGLGPSGVGVADLGGEEFECSFCRSGVGREKGWECAQVAGLDLGDGLGHFRALSP